MINDFALYQNAGKPIRLDLIFSLSGNVVTKASFVGVLRAKPVPNGSNDFNVYGLVHKAGFVIIDAGTLRRL